MPTRPWGDDSAPMDRLSPLGRELTGAELGVSCHYSQDHALTTVNGQPDGEGEGSTAPKTDFLKFDDVSSEGVLPVTTRRNSHNAV